MKARFKKKKYVVVKNVISPEISDFLYQYFLLKRQVAQTMFKERFISPFTTYFGVWNDSCEVSTTLFLGGDNWPIFIDPTGSNNVMDPGKNTIKPDAPKGVQVNLNPGDMLVYSGCDLEHWREAFDGKDCGQVFLHYNNTETPGADKNLYDKRPHLGLTSDFKKP